jgi:hypothetical protein
MTMNAQNELGCALLTIALMIGLLPPTALARLLGLSSPRSQVGPWWAARFLVLGLLLVVLNPEVRVLLVFSQFIGVDLFVMLIVLQFRYCLTGVSPLAVSSLLARLLSQLLPRLAPSFSVIRMSPALALYALLLPVAVVGLRGWGMTRAFVSRITNIDGL